MADPGCDGLPGLLRYFELHRTPCLLLHDNRPCGHTVAAGDVLYTQLHQVAGAQSAPKESIRTAEADNRDSLHMWDCSTPYSRFREM